MIKIAFITPDPNMVDTIYSTYAEHSKRNDAPGEREYAFTVFSAANFEGVPPQALEADIIISRGLLASQLKENRPLTSVVEVPIGSELLTSVYQARQRHGNLPVAVMGSFNLVYSSQGIADALGVDIKAYLQTANDPEYVRELVSSIIAEGRRIIVSGANTHPEVLKHPCHAVQIGMSRESVWQAISEAKHDAVIRRREGERAEQFKAVLNHTGEGVIATDAKGGITVFNAAATEILHLPDAAGRPLRELPLTGQLGALIRSKADHTDSIVPFHGELLSVNKVSIFLHGDFSGHIITLQKSSSIQKTEGNIRRQLYAKGHVARYALEDVIGESVAIQAALAQARSYAAVSSNIMIVGDTGTGKEMFAQGIHNLSERRAAPFVAINCAALAKNLLESELFGYAEGAFTGALKGGMPGIFEIAHTGTIFLDEISEIPLDLQGRLLRVLQERQIMRLGDNKIVPIDVRIISATNKPLHQEAAKGNFRKDLFYRLNVLVLPLPELNARGGDIIRLAAHFLAEYCGLFKKRPVTLGDAACRALLAHRWDGNIRELRNVCECLAALNTTGVLSEEELSSILLAPAPPPAAAAPGVDYAREIRRLDKDRILAALHAADGDRTQAAGTLGISRTTLWRKLKNFSIEERERPERAAPKSRRVANNVSIIP